MSMIRASSFVGINVASLNLNRRSIVGGVSGLAVLIGMMAPAFAQDATTSIGSGGLKRDSLEGVPAEDIVVTGTLIRGQGPTGSDIKVVTSEEISQLGISDTSQLLGSLPADANFNSRPQVGGFSQFQTVNAPVLRYLGGGNSGSNSTLLLLNGHRLPGMGVLQTSPDIDAIPPGALQRVDVVPEGGSATYGADAVGGVVNLITRKRFDGLEVGGHLGGAADYTQYDANVTAGKEWSNGSIWATYNFAHHGLIRNSDRDYVRDRDYTGGQPVGQSLSCNPGNYQAGGLIFTNTPPFFQILPITTYPIANGVPTRGAANRCDPSQLTTLLPEEDRHSAMAGLDVDLSDSINFNVTAFYTNRRAKSFNSALNEYSVTASYPGFPNGSVYGTLQPTFGDLYNDTKLETFGITPQITVKLGSEWQVVGLYNYGEGKARFYGPVLDGSALQAQSNSGAFNPFTGLFATNAAGQAALAYQQAYRSFSSGEDMISNGRVVADGPLFSLPGGQVRAAVGGEIMREGFTQRNGSALETNLSAILRYSDNRTVKSAFGELSVPVFGADNAMAGFQSLTLSAAGRYDHYSDFGGTFNPKFGITWKPVNGWTLRGNWGKSFQAPSLASKAETIPTGVTWFPANTFGAPGGTSDKAIILLFPGGGLNLRPQKATTWQIGTDFRPVFIPGFAASVTYYNIDFSDRIGTPTFYNPSFYSLYPDSYRLNSSSNPITTAEIRQYIATVSPTLVAAANLGGFLADPSKVYALENGLSQNLARVKTTGLDFNVDYQHTVSFGSVFAGVAGTRILTYDQQATPTSKFTSMDDNEVIRWRTSAHLGATAGGLLGRITWNRTGGFKIAPNVANAFQSKVDDFNVFNVALQYEPKAGGILEGTAVTLNIDNVFNTDPPSLNRTNGRGGAAGYFGFTIGRFVQLGFRKKF